MCFAIVWRKLYQVHKVGKERQIYVFFYMWNKKNYTIIENSIMGWKGGLGEGLGKCWSRGTIFQSNRRTKFRSLNPYSNFSQYFHTVYLIIVYKNLCEFKDTSFTWIQSFKVTYSMKNRRLVINDIVYL